LEKCSFGAMIDWYFFWIFGSCIKIYNLRVRDVAQEWVCSSGVGL
jgi:hypothetical protein